MLIRAEGVRDAALEAANRADAEAVALRGRLADMERDNDARRSMGRWARLRDAWRGGMKKAGQLSLVHSLQAAGSHGRGVEHDAAGTARRLRPRRRRTTPRKRSLEDGYIHG